MTTELTQFIELIFRIIFQRFNTCILLHSFIPLLVWLISIESDGAGAVLTHNQLLFLKAKAYGTVGSVGIAVFWLRVHFNMQISAHVSSTVRLVLTRHP